MSPALPPPGRLVPALALVLALPLALGIGWLNTGMERLVLGAGGPEASAAALGRSLLLLELGAGALALLAAALPVLVLRRRMQEVAAAEARARHLALHDPLTGLPNRAGFADRLAGAIALGRRHGRHTGVLLLDLDRFKEVNDTLGHAAGDALLHEVATRLSATVRGEDVVVRLGGDEFAILQIEARQPEGAAILARRLQEAMAAPFDLMGHRAQLGCSIGIALAPPDDDGPDPAALLRMADTALYRAKEEGRGRCRFHEAGMDAALRARWALERDLRQALAEDGFALHYQPLFTLADRRLAGFEALLRWDHPERGPVPPADFLPLAAETGLIVPLGRWILRTACRDAAAWPAEILLSVNLAPAQFRLGDIEAELRTALAESGLDPRRLELEVTEALLQLEQPEAVLAKLERLRAMGVGISMDDFGTGPSCLGWLWRFPFDRLKIDQRMIRALQRDPRAARMVQAILGLGRTLEVAVAAEGVETEAQAEALRSQGCAEGQGYLLGRPLDRDGAAALIAAGHGAPAMAAE
jgi:diguanylate cyclase (GGDEF)-like protein